MKIYNKFFHLKFLYIFFIFLSLNIFFFSTVKSEEKTFDIDNIEISRPFEIDFDKNDVIDEGFKKAFFELISLIVKSSDKKKINLIKKNEIKGMVEKFSIKEFFKILERKELDKQKNKVNEEARRLSVVYKDQI